MKPFYAPALWRAFIPLALLLVVAPVKAQESPPTANAFIAQPATLELIDIDEYLALPKDLTDILDSKIATLSLQRTKAAAVHNLLFGEKYFAIGYDNDKTKTAAETYLTRSGNCLSLAALYVASARRVGLDAVFQYVDVPLQWETAEQFNLVYGHTNVLVRIPGKHITVELVDLYPAEESKNFPSTPMNDQQALSSYYNNRGVELLKQGYRSLAIDAFEKSLTLDDRYSDAWVNRGVAAKLSGDIELAEQAYLKGYRYNDQNVSALNNLYALYLKTGEAKKANKIQSKIHKHLLKNPFYLAKAAEKNIAAKHDLETAIKWLEKAIKIKRDEAEFHKLLAQALYFDKQFNDSRKAMRQALALTDSPEQSQLWQKKLAAINQTIDHNH